MLLLTRKSLQTIRIGDQIEITVLEIGGGRIRIAIQAPQDVGIVREELAVDRPTGQGGSQSRNVTEVSG